MWNAAILNFTAVNCCTVKWRSSFLYLDKVSIGQTCSLVEMLSHLKNCQIALGICWQTSWSIHSAGSKSWSLFSFFWTRAWQYWRWGRKISQGRAMLCRQVLVPLPGELVRDKEPCLLYTPWQHCRATLKIVINILSHDTNNGNTAVLLWKLLLTYYLLHAHNTKPSQKLYFCMFWIWVMCVEILIPFEEVSLINNKY